MNLILQSLLTILSHSTYPESILNVIRLNEYLIRALASPRPDTFIPRDQSRS